MKKIIEKLRNEIKEESTDQVAWRRAIQRLTWVEGSESAVAAIRAERDESGRRKHGKKALKSYRRPETGPERNEMHRNKNGQGSEDVRVRLLALGLLRGRPYARIEPTNSSIPPVYGIWTVLNDLTDGNSPYWEQEIVDWLQGNPIVRKEVA